MSPSNHDGAYEFHHASDETLVVVGFSIEPGEESFAEAVLVPVVVYDLRWLPHDVENCHAQGKEGEEGSRDRQEGMVLVKLE